MPARLPVYQPLSKRDFAAEARRQAHAEALETAASRLTRPVATALRLSVRYVEEWIHGDKRSPGESLEQIVEICRAHRRAEIEAMEPVRVLVHRLGYGLCPAPPTTEVGSVAGTAADAGRQFAEAIAAALAYSRECTARQEQGISLCPMGRRRALIQIHSAVDQLHRLAAEVEHLFADEEGRRIAA